MGFLAVGVVAAAAVSAVPTLKITKHAQGSRTPPAWKSWADYVPKDLPVSGNYQPFGVFYTELTLGTPGKVYNVAIDTGSYRTIVTDASCSSCNTTSKRAYQGYDSAASSTSKKVSTFSNSYKTCQLDKFGATCTIRGSVYSDHFTFGSAGSGTVSFGSITYQTANFNQFESIHGLMGTDSLEGTDNFEGPSPIQVVTGGNNVYAMCFQNNGKGKLTVGGTDPNLHTAAFKYTPLVFDISLSIAVNGMSVGGQAVEMKATEATLDSGTTVLLLPGHIFSAVQTAFTAVQSEAATLFSSKCAKVTDPTKWPRLNFQLNGTELSIPPESYLLPGSSSGEYCLGITNMGTGPSSMFIIGDTVMSQYYVSYDRKQKRVGWAPAAPACFE